MCAIVTTDLMKPLLIKTNCLFYIEKTQGKYLKHKENLRNFISD